MSIFRDRHGDINPWPIMFSVIAIVIIVAVGWALFLTSVPAGTVGIQNTFGSVSDNTFDPGLHVKGPFTHVIPMSTRTQKYMDYGTNDVATITALSNEGLTVSMGIAVNYHLVPGKATEVYKAIGTDYSSVVLVNPIHAVPRDIISKHDVKTLYSASMEGSPDRAMIEAELYDGIVRGVNAVGVPNSIVIESVFIRNINLPTTLTSAIENKLKMEQEITQKEFEVRKQEMEANRMRAEAQGIADANKIIADSLSDSYLRWYTIEMMKTHSGATYFIPVGPDGTPNPALVKTV